MAGEQSPTSNKGKGSNKDRGQFLREPEHKPLEHGLIPPFAVTTSMTVPPQSRQTWR
jgi:hypothetical protein